MNDIQEEQMTVTYIGNQTEVNIDAMVHTRELNTEEPYRMPLMDLDESLVCVLDMGLQQECFLVENLADAKAVWRDSITRGALGIEWYLRQTRPLGRVTSKPYDPQASVAELRQALKSIMDPSATDDPLRRAIMDIAKDNNVSLTLVVIKAIEGYALGNLGIANRLTHRSLTFTVKEVEELVGWPLSQHNAARVSDIWDRFRR
jgi:hypothetical protein